MTAVVYRSAELVPGQVEGGPTLAAAFVKARLVDRIVAYLSPVLLGAGPSAVGDLGIGTIADALRPRVTDISVLEAAPQDRDQDRDQARDVPNIRITMEVD